MTRNKEWKILREMSKVVCMKMCSEKLSDCNTDECEFQKLLLELLKEIG